MKAPIQIGFIGLGQAGARLAGSLLETGYDLAVLDLQPSAAESLLAAGARWGENPKALAQSVDVLITCLPNPAASASVMEESDGALEGLSEGKFWLDNEHNRRRGSSTPGSPSPCTGCLAG